MPSGTGLSKLCDFLSCCDCGSCDWPRRNKRSRSEKEKHVYIPPKARSRVQPTSTGNERGA